MPTRNNPDSSLHSLINQKPYCSVGAGQLTSFVWKTGGVDAGWRYRFNIFRLSSRGGYVTQMFAPSDLFHFVKLTQVLAAVLADDGCLAPVDRGVLIRLAANLDELLTNTNTQPTNHNGATHGDTPHT